MKQPPKTQRILQEILAACDPCQRIQIRPKQLKVTYDSEHVVFNEHVLPGTTYVDNKPILHVVDELTHLSAAKFLSDISVTQIWESLFFSCLCLIYTGPTKQNPSRQFNNTSGVDGVGCTNDSRGLRSRRTTSQFNDMIGIDGVGGIKDTEHSHCRRTF